MFSMRDEDEEDPPRSVGSLEYEYLPHPSFFSVSFFLVRPRNEAGALRDRLMKPKTATRSLNRIKWNKAGLRRRCSSLWCVHQNCCQEINRRKLGVLQLWRLWAWSGPKRNLERPCLLVLSRL